jgi:hypothetical protein
MMGNWTNGWSNPSLNIAFFILLLWGLFWKGLALWRSARSGEKNWFIALLIVQTWGIVEIAYLFYISKNKMTLEELKKMFNIKVK